MPKVNKISQGVGRQWGKKKKISRQIKRECFKKLYRRILSSDLVLQTGTAVGLVLL